MSSKTDKKAIVEKRFSFTVSTGFQKSHEYSVNESQLTKRDKDILMWQLLSAWENNTAENRIKFFRSIESGVLPKIKK